MSQLSNTLDLDHLAEQTPWLRRLARTLVADADADDLVQDTYLIAAERAPADRPLGPWLVRVMRNLARMRWRSDARRRAREARGTDVDAASSPDGLVEQLEIQQRLVRLVLELPEPLRAVVLLRYVEGLSSSAIAERLDVPSGTVRWRLKRATDQLRAALDEDAGGHRALWIAPLGRFATDGAPGIDASSNAATAAGALAMKKLVAVIAVIAAFGLGALLIVSPDAPDRPLAAVAEPPSRALAPSPALGAAPPAWADRAAAPPRRIAGRVIRDGAPLAGARVQLLAGHRFSAPAAALDERRTGADGTFDFGRRPAVGYAIAAVADGSAPVIRPLHLGDPSARPQPDAVVIELGGCRARLSGVVVDSGGPIAGAALRVGASRDDQHALVAESDGAGRYALCLPGSPATVRIDAAGYASATLAFEHEGDLERDITLVPEAIIAGRVVDERGETVSDAWILAEPAVPILSSSTGAELAARSAVSASSGRFELVGLAPGPYRVLVAAGERAGAHSSVEVVGPGDHLELELRVSRAAVIRGRVVSGGAPVAGIDVGISPLTAAPIEAVFSGPDGRFELRGVPRKPLILSSESAALVGPRRVDTTAGDAEITLEIEALASIEGRVTRAGAPVIGAEVFSDRQRRPALSDARGFYRIDGARPGTGAVWAASDRLGAKTRGRGDVSLIAGEVARVDLELDLAAEVAGRVVDAGGAAVGGVEVRLRSPASGDESRCLSDRRGAFRCAGLGGGDYLPAVHPPGVEHPLPWSGVAPPPIAVADGAARIEGVVLAIDDRRLAIRGRVLGGDGAPIADVRVTAESGDSPPGSGAVALVSARTGVDGRFAVVGLAPGSYAVRAFSSGGSAAIAGVAAGAAPITIELERFGAIEVTLDGFSDVVAVSARSRQLADRGIEWARVRDGIARFAAVAPGTYYVTAQEPGEAGVLDAAVVVVEAEKTARVGLVAGGTATVRGRVVELPSREPVAQMFCNATVAVGGVRANNAVLRDPSEPGLVTDSAGRFEIRAAPAGREIRVECWSSDNAVSHAAAIRAVEPGAAIEVELLAVRRGAGVELGLRLDGWRLPPAVEAIEPGGVADRGGLRVRDRLITAGSDAVPLERLSPDGALAAIERCVERGRCAVAASRGGELVELKLDRL